MIVIADASPLRYAAIIGIGDALFALFGRVVIPPAVHAELSASAAPSAVREWLERNRDRMAIRPVISPLEPTLARLDPGEREAILLAQQIPGALLIIDDRDGRVEAARRGVAITGLPGVIRDAALRGLIGFDATIHRLKQTDFRLSPAVERIVRRQFLGHE